jgi:hypothetical protein
VSTTPDAAYAHTVSITVFIPYAIRLASLSGVHCLSSVSLVAHMFRRPVHYNASAPSALERPSTEEEGIVHGIGTHNRLACCFIRLVPGFIACAVLIGYLGGEDRRLW